jgi:hypothetical protein
VRLFALLVALLVVAMQPRALAQSAPLGSSVPRIAEHAEHIDSNALRVDSAVCVTATPALARAPSLPGAFGRLQAWRWPSERVDIAPLLASQRAQSVTHFHSKRRIPRMNSEEPPRA